jgi:glycerophosphoryl diester phosphodiesterase
MFYKIAHRGASGYEVENTIESFQKAIEIGVDGIELDVHVCASGEVVVFHDFTLDRLTKTIGPIANFTLSELQQIEIKDKYKIPSLLEVLELTKNKCWLNVELKGMNTAKATFDVLKRFCEDKNYQRSNFLISSFQIEELKTFSQLSNDFPLAVLTQASIEQAIDLATEIKAKAIHPHFSLLTEVSCKKAKDLGLQINTWTVNEKFDIEHVKRFSIDGIISDFPDRI